MTRLAPRLAIVGAGSILLVGVVAGPAAAHISVVAPDATQGGFGVISFRVPTESDTASTIGLKVQLPADQPLAFLAVRPQPGWSYTVRKARLGTPVRTDEGEVTEVVSVIEWTATSRAAGIKPGEYGEFQVDAGPLPKAPSMTFKAIQRLSDGSETAWIEQPAPGSSTEPEHPAPTLTLAAAAGSSPGSQPSSGARTGTPSQPAGPAVASQDVATRGAVAGAYVVAVLGLLAGLAGLALGLSARRNAATVVDPERAGARTGAE